MRKFEEPEIKVTKFMNEDVVTTSSGYEQNQTQTTVDWSYNVVQGGLDGDFPL